MKKAIFILSICMLTVLSTSCKKAWTCHCDYYNVSVGSSEGQHTIEGTKSDAEVHCENWEATNSTHESSDAECYIE